MAGAWTFGLLGELEISKDGGPVPLRTGKLRVLLATLLLRANRTVSADELIERLWGDAAPDKAWTTAQAYVMRLRQALGDDTRLIQTRPGGYLIGIDAHQLDLLRFRGLTEQADGLDAIGAAAKLHEALSLWRGPALAGIPSESLHRDAVPLLTEEKLGALERRIDLDLELGRHSEIISDLVTLTGQYPYRERFHGQHMLALFRSGRQAEALEHYRRIQSMLNTELGVEPGADLRRLHEEILRDDPKIHSRQTAARAVPRQLPADVTAFTGRAEDLAKLDSLSEARTVLLSAIHGTAGIGKTALAVHWGHRAADRFPDGQLCVNLRGFDIARPPVDPSEALGQFLRALDVDPQRIPYDMDERAALYRSTIAGKRMLILLDNAAAVDQVHPLLPGTSTCLVLITSRNQLTGLVAVDGAHNITLDVLSPAEAIALLENVLGRERVTADPEAAAELARLCGYLPLALRVATGKLIMHERQKIAELLVELRSGSRLAALEIAGDRRAAVRAAFDLSYLALKPAQQSLFRRLSLVPGPDFTAHVAAALLDVPPDNAARLLTRLANVHLVESAAPGRYRLHDLLRLYANDRRMTDESTQDSEKAGERLLDWYVATAGAAANVLYPNRHLLGHDGSVDFADKAEAWAWLDAEHANLTAAVSAATSSAAWRLADATRGFFQVRGYYDDWYTTALAGLRAAESAADDQAQAAMHLNVGTAHWGRGDYQRFLDHSSKALDLARRAGWMKGQARALDNLGIAHIGLGQAELAMESVNQALATWRAVGSPAEVMRSLTILADTHLETGNLRDSVGYFREALALARQTDDILDQIQALFGLGLVCWQLGEPHDAEQWHTASLEAAREQGSRQWQAHNLAALAEVVCRLGRAAEAERMIQQAIEFSDEINRQHTEAYVLGVAGRVALNLGQPAVQYFERALRIACEISQPYDEIDALIGLAGANLGLGNHSDARVFGEQASARAQEVGYRVLAGRALTVLAEIEFGLGEHGRGVEHADQALELHRQTGHEPGVRRTLRLLGGRVGGTQRSS